jgi:hypothetical protein
MISGDGVTPRWWLIQVRGSGGVWTTKLQPGAAMQIAVDSVASANPPPDEIAVSAISATGVESEPAVVAWPPTANAPSAPARRGRRR